MSSVKTRGVIYSATTIGRAETQGCHSNLNGQLRCYSLLLCTNIWYTCDDGDAEINSR